MIRNHSAGRIRVLAALFAIAVAAVFYSGTASAGEHMRIDGARLQAMIDSGEPLVIVDVREPHLYKRGHIPGAINIPYDGARGRVLKELKPTERVVFVCHGGPMGDELGELLTSNGYTEVYNLIGGMRRWRGPVEK